MIFLAAVLFTLLAIAWGVYHQVGQAARQRVALLKVEGALHKILMGIEDLQVGVGAVLDRLVSIGTDTRTSAAILQKAEAEWDADAAGEEPEDLRPQPPAVLGSCGGPAGDA